MFKIKFMHAKFVHVGGLCKLWTVLWPLLWSISLGANGQKMPWPEISSGRVLGYVRLQLKFERSPCGPL